MNTKLTLALAALMVVSTTAVAGTYHRDSIGPTTVNIAAVGEFGVAVCDTSGVIALLACGTGGVGAIIDVSDLSSASNFATGSCSVTPNNAQNTNGVVDGSYSWSCGTDRDDDTFVTNVDLTGSSDPNLYDDDFAGASSPSNGVGTSVPVCFRRDRTSTVITDPNAAGGDWDDVAFFIALNVPSAPVDVGSFSVDLTLTNGSGCGTVNGGNVSGHTHGTFYA